MTTNQMRPDLWCTYQNKAYLVWLMFRVLSNQHYLHHTNQKLRAWANTVFQNRRVCRQAFPSFPSPSPVILFFFALVPTFSTNSQGNACYAGYTVFFSALLLLVSSRKKSWKPFQEESKEMFFLFCMKQSLRLTGISVWLYQAFNGLTKCKPR